MPAKVRILLPALKKQIKMKSKNNTFEEIWNALKKSKKVLMSLHPRPDGDSLGSCTALKYVLEREGKKVKLYSKDELSENLAALPICKEVEFNVDLSEIDWTPYDTVIFLDHGGLNYYSNDMTKKLKENFVINIDHHDSNEYFGKMNYIDNKENASVCSILTKFFRSISINVNKDIAKRLFLGVATDTGFFTHKNTDLKAFDDAAFLSEKGVDYFNDIYEKILAGMDLKIKKLHGILIDNLQIKNTGRKKFAFSFIEKKDVKRLNLSIADLRLGIDAIMNIKDIDFELMLCEREDEIKGSFRSSTVDVSRFAEQFGGGGHKLAAGFVIKNLSLKKAEEKVFQAIDKVGIHPA